MQSDLRSRSIYQSLKCACLNFLYTFSAVKVALRFLCGHYAKNKPKPPPATAVNNPWFANVTTAESILERSLGKRSCLYCPLKISLSFARRSDDMEGNDEVVSYNTSRERGRRWN